MKFSSHPILPTRASLILLLAIVSSLQFASASAAGGIIAAESNVKHRNIVLHARNLVASNLRILSTKDNAASDIEEAHASSVFLNNTEDGGHQHEKEALDDAEESHAEDANEVIVPWPEDIAKEAITNEGAQYDSPDVRDHVKESTLMDYVCGGVILTLVGGFSVFRRPRRGGYASIMV